jgi:hypothetical protein
MQGKHDNERQELKNEMDEMQKLHDDERQELKNELANTLQKI